MKIFSLLAAFATADTLSENSDCNLDKVVGLCRGAMASWYYNKATGLCSEFCYGKSFGNSSISRKGGEIVLYYHF